MAMEIMDVIARRYAAAKKAWGRALNELRSAERDEGAGSHIKDAATKAREDAQILEALVTLHAEHEALSRRVVMLEGSGGRVVQLEDALIEGVALFEARHVDYVARATEHEQRASLWANAAAKAPSFQRRVLMNEIAENEEGIAKAFLLAAGRLRDVGVAARVYGAK